MEGELHNLTNAQKDILKEICNIGAGSSATALAHLLNRKISMNVPSVRILPFQQVPEVVGGAERQLVGVFLHVDGEAPCNILFFLSVTSAKKFVDLVLNRALGTTHELDKLNRSALEEIGNIISGSFLTALSKVTGLNFVPSVPSLSIDMAGALLNIAVLAFGHFGDEALVIDTNFIDHERRLEGYYFLVPEPGSLTKILNSLGVTHDRSS
ncbi:MAG: chemotaxis protein CheC [Clostridia bacterium]|nr:chemotaxis protein CheC [Clostridia bacterium]